MTRLLKPDSKIFVAGHRGLAGSAIVRKLKAEGHRRLILKTREELDLLNQSAVQKFYASEKPEFVFVAAARVGGIIANSRYGGDFLYENLTIQNHLIHGALENKVTKLLFMGSSCIYPKQAPQPMKEDSLLTGPLEETNIGYAIAKIAGLKLCELYQKQYGARFISAMPTNLYGPGDNFHPENSHVIAGLMRRFHDAKAAGLPTVSIWGTGKPTREFLHSDDLADALYFLMNSYEGTETVNVGTGEEITIRGLAEALKKVTGFTGELTFDTSRPDGTLRKLNDCSRLFALGWKPKIKFEDGLKAAYQWALEHKSFES